MFTRTRSRSKLSHFPTIQDSLTLLLEAYCIEDGFEKLTDTQDKIKAAFRSMREITKQVVSKSTRHIFMPSDQHRSGYLRAGLLKLKRFIPSEIHLVSADPNRPSKEADVCSGQPTILKQGWRCMYGC